MTFAHELKLNAASNTENFGLAKTLFAALEGQPDESRARVRMPDRIPAFTNNKKPSPQTGLFASILYSRLKTSNSQGQL